MGDPILTFGLCVAAIALVTVVMNRLKLPFVIGLLFAGIMFGPFSPLAGINVAGVQVKNFLVGDTGEIEFFASIGAILILFQIGIEFSLVKLTKVGSGTIIAAAIKIGLIFLFIYGFSYLLLGLDNWSSIFIGILVSMSSTPIIVKLMSDNKPMYKEEVQLVTAILILEDVFAVFVLGLMNGMATSGTSQQAIAWSLAKTLVAFLFTYIVLSEIVKRIINYTGKTDEALVLSMLAIVVIAAGAADYVGLSPEVGAFLAGSSIAALEQAKKIEKTLRSFSILFSSLFFFSIGMFVNPGAMVSQWGLLAALLVATVIAKFAGAGIGTYVVKNSGGQAVFAGLALLTVSEISLLIAKEGSKLGIATAQVGASNILGIMAGLIFATAIISSLLIRREESIYWTMAELMPGRAVRGARVVSIGINEVREQIEGEDPDLVSPGAGFEIIHNAYHAVIITVLLLAVLFTAELVASQQIRGIVNTVAAIIALYLFLKLAVRLKKIFDAVVSMCIDTEKQKAEKKFLINLGFCVLFGLFLMSSPTLQGQVYGVQVQLAARIVCASIAMFYLFAAFRSGKEMKLLVGKINRTG
ncbi:Glutathione-regulated potassium-efflux system protein KefB [Candidatus Gugararchaeum adminiculabundum]|nr:Glutathione-regulated potassium-efflux system protein KefB [Candidatus Gugararchaeum adminiculabundum]